MCHTPYVTPITLIHQSRAVFLPLASNWRKINKLIVCLCVVRRFEKEDFLENSCILSCLGQLKSILFNLLCIFKNLSDVTHRPMLTFDVEICPTAVPEFRSRSLKAEPRVKT